VNKLALYTNSNHKIVPISKKIALIGHRGETTMKNKKILPIGVDDFRRLRESEKEHYYVDKSLMIEDFLDYSNFVTLITRPRRFGKTLNMTMIRDFFDINQGSADIFAGLKIMETGYIDQLNSRPVIFLSFKSCSGADLEELKISLALVIKDEYFKYEEILTNSKKVDWNSNQYSEFYQICKAFKKLEEEDKNKEISDSTLKRSLVVLTRTITNFYGQKPLLLIDEYDQPLINAHEEKFRETFSKRIYSDFLGDALKGNTNLHQALLTGIQRVAKESIFSKLNNIVVYTVLNKHYAPYFGLTSEETSEILKHYDLGLTNDVKHHYDGYLFGGIEMYNPWSILGYANEGMLKNYWLKTSTNMLIKESVLDADEDFHRTFEKLIKDGEVDITLNLEASFAELPRADTLWGLFVNAGYLTVISEDYAFYSFVVRIPNDEIKTEFKEIVGAYTKLSSQLLKDMLRALTQSRMSDFMEIYQSLVIQSTSYHDAKEARLTKVKRDVEPLVETDSHNFLAKNEQYGSHDNAYHMLLLGMLINLRDIYQITSNIESGHGRSDLILESKDASRSHIVIEFKMGEDVEKLKESALAQIHEKKYYASLSGEVLCIGIAHNKKACQLAHETITV